MAAARAAENHRDKWGFTWHILWGIYISMPTWTHSQNSLAGAEAPSLKVYSHGKSLKWSGRPSNQNENSHKVSNETGHPVGNMMESQWKLRQQHHQNFPMEGKPL